MTAPFLHHAAPATGAAECQAADTSARTGCAAGAGDDGDAALSVNGSCAELTKLTCVRWLDVAPPPPADCDFWAAVATLKRLGALRVLNTTGTRLTS